MNPLPQIRRHARTTVRAIIRESFIPDADNVLNVLASSRMNPLPQISMIFTHYCGSEFIRESFIPAAVNVLDVLAPSRMNPLPQIR
jgi:hypothetical protein